MVPRWRLLMRRGDRHKRARLHSLVSESASAPHLKTDRGNLLRRFWGESCRVENQFVSSSRAGMQLARLQSNDKRSSDVPTYMPGVNAPGFGKDEYSRHHFVLLGFTGLALLSGTVSHADDQNAPLQEQPQAKSNIHTARWRIFTDKARDLCRRGSFDNAENYFHRALQEARLGFGEDDPHVASCYNNLAELFRMKKEYDKAEPLYLEAVKRLRESSGVEDGSVGFALHNLGGFYLLQRKLEQAQGCYEEALKIKGRALGTDHPEYANTMFHLGEVIRMRGELQDGLALVRDSIRILEQVGLGNTTLAVKRLTRFSELLVFVGQLDEAEMVQRKILQVIEFSKDFTFNDTVTALENLSAILQKQGKLDECAALLEESIGLLKDNKGNKDIQIVGSMLKLGSVCFQQGRTFTSKDHMQALASYDKAESLLCDAVKVAELYANAKQRAPKRDTLHHTLLLAQSLTALGNLRLHKLELLANNESLWKTCKDAERVLRLAVSLLEEIIVQQGNESSSEVWKLYKDCTLHLADVNIKISELQSQGHA
ncbi:hypothetical protein GOP47_0019280 [Adiantum capillus-veneris]|uniref:Kinesin light chain n=1 Tax=Adiantum capillus-veneris TaxID=13818 RepID=A0A9D4ZBH5_ADICA|nr:hypothetical protein GOP47_0019280 [Adiantum capillus-veneris]